MHIKSPNSNQLQSDLNIAFAPWSLTKPISYNLVMQVNAPQNPNPIQLQSDLNIAFAQLNKCFEWNFQFLNFQICYSWILTKPISFNLIMQVNAPQNPNPIQLQSDLNMAFAQLNKCFEWNVLFLSFDKTHFIQFNNASKCTSVTEIRCEDEQISIANETKFLGLYTNNNNNLSWKTNIENKFNKWINVTFTWHNMLIVKKYAVITTEEFIPNFTTVCSYL